MNVQRLIKVMIRRRSLPRWLASRRHISNIMNSKTRVVLAGVAGIAGYSIAWASPPTPKINSVTENPAAPANFQVMQPAPSTAYVWMTGHWNSEGGQWKWIAAHWDLPPAQSAIWVSGHWIAETSGWIWVNGAWNVAQAPQSSATPPQPPGQAPTGANGVSAQGSQILPLPSIQAPYLAVQYPPGGQDAAINQPMAAADYSTGDYGYDSIYPGYYWDGDAWTWGGYPGYFGFGQVWGYGGWGYGRGGRGSYRYGGWGYGNGAHGSSNRGGFAGHAGAAHFGGGGRHR
jgi:hypothetical protein